jgi:hypothetical protein
MLSVKALRLHDLRGISPELPRWHEREAVTRNRHCHFDSCGLQGLEEEGRDEERKDHHGREGRQNKEGRKAGREKKKKTGEGTSDSSGSGRRAR